MISNYAVFDKETGFFKPFFRIVDQISVRNRISASTVVAKISAPDVFASNFLHFKFTTFLLLMRINQALFNLCGKKTLLATDL